MVRKIVAEDVHVRENRFVGKRESCQVAKRRWTPRFVRREGDQVNGERVRLGLGWTRRPLGRAGAGNKEAGEHNYGEVLDLHTVRVSLIVIKGSPIRFINCKFPGVLLPGIPCAYF